MPTPLSDFAAACISLTGADFPAFNDADIVLFILS